MPIVEKKLTPEQNLARIHYQNDKTAAYRLRDLASSFKHLSPHVKVVVTNALGHADGEAFLSELAKEILAYAEQG